jgi:hypothetical protein
MSSTFDESFQNTLPITMRRGRTFRSGRTRPADGQSNNPETLSRVQSLADCTIDTLESSFRKRQRIRRETGNDDLADSASHLASASHDYQPCSPGEEGIAKRHRDWQRKFDDLLHKRGRGAADYASGGYDFLAEDYSCRRKLVAGHVQRLRRLASARLF